MQRGLARTCDAPVADATGPREAGVRGLAEQPAATLSKDELAALCRALHEHGEGRELALPALRGRAAELCEAIAACVGAIDRERQALRRFAGDAAHQLRTPLAVLSARIDAPAQSWNVAQLRSDLHWMGRLIDQLITSSKASATVVDLTETFDLRALAVEVASALAPLAIYRGRGVALDGRTDHDTVRGDPTLAFEALSNLVENALDHAPEGSTVQVVTRGNGRVEVRDRGPGVPEAERERIFARFAQGGRPTEGGAGLGLSIATEIMGKHRGSLTYRDRRGGGAVFALAFLTGGDEAGATSDCRQHGVPG